MYELRPGCQYLNEDARRLQERQAGQGSQTALAAKIADLVAEELARLRREAKLAPVLVAAFEQELHEQRHAAQRAGFKAIVAERRQQNERARQARQPVDPLADLRRMLERWQGVASHA